MSPCVEPSRAQQIFQSHNAFKASCSSPRRKDPEEVRKQGRLRTQTNNKHTVRTIESNAANEYISQERRIIWWCFSLFFSWSVLIQKRLKKEKRSKRRLQEALEEEVKLRDQAEHTLLHTANAHTGAHRLNLPPAPPLPIPSVWRHPEHLVFFPPCFDSWLGFTAGAIFIFPIECQTCLPAQTKASAVCPLVIKCLLRINDPNAGHQSSAVPPHTEAVNQDADGGGGHEDSRLDTKAAVQGARR